MRGKETSTAGGMRQKQDVGIPEVALGEESSRNGDRVKRYLGGKVARFCDTLSERETGYGRRKERRKEGRLAPGALLLDGQVDNGSLAVTEGTGRRTSSRSKMVRSILDLLRLSYMGDI